MQDFLNWGKVTAGWVVPEKGGPYFSPGVKVGELVPGHKDIVMALGIASASPGGTDHPSLGGKIIQAPKQAAPMSVMGPVDAQGSGARGQMGGKGQKRESRS